MCNSKTNFLVVSCQLRMHQVAADANKSTHEDKDKISNFLAAIGNETRRKKRRQKKTTDLFDYHFEFNRVCLNRKQTFISSYLPFSGELGEGAKINKPGERREGEQKLMREILRGRLAQHMFTGQKYCNKGCQSPFTVCLVFGQKEGERA